MATSKLSASTDFFKQLSLECQQQTLTLHLLDTFVSLATERGGELRDNRLMVILDQAGLFVTKAKTLQDRLEETYVYVCRRLSPDLWAGGAW